MRPLLPDTLALEVPVLRAHRLRGLLGVTRFAIRVAIADFPVADLRPTVISRTAFLESQNQPKTRQLQVITKGEEVFC